MKKTKLSRIAALLAAGALLFGGMFMSCSDGGDDGNGGKSDTGKSDPGQSTGGSYGTLTDDAIATTAPSAAGTITLYKGNVTKSTVSSSTGTVYDTITAALAAIPTSGDTGTYTIALTSGTYNEDGLAYTGTATIKILGLGTATYGTDVLIYGKGSDMTTEKGRDLIEIQGSASVILDSITLKNSYGTTKGDAQAETLGYDGTGTVAAYNCSFLSGQDTLRTTGKAWFYGCYIEGDVDFLWMESAGIVALYEKCVIRAISSRNASAYFTAPRMTISSSVGKGLVIYNSHLQAEGGLTELELGRTPWSSGYINQVAIVGTDLATNSTLNSKIWRNDAIGGSTQYIGFKTDSYFAKSSAGYGAILDDSLISTEYAGRNNIVNRIFRTTRQRYQKGETIWDINSVPTENGWTVTEDNSQYLLDGEVEGNEVVYDFSSSTANGYTDTTLDGFAYESGKTHAAGKAGSTISFSVTGNAAITVYGYYAGYGTIQAGEQGVGIYSFNNGTTNSTVEKPYINYSGATTVTVTAATSSFITKIVVEYDDSLSYTAVSSIDVSSSSDIEIVGVGLTLSASVSPDNATNADVLWSSGDETVGTIDQYSGKVTFLAAGSVTFTATAADGSGVTGTKTCNPIKADWTWAEYYDVDGDLDASDEEHNVNGKYFQAASTKSTTEATFTTLDGTSVTTKKGVKMNSSGKLSISTLAPATLTIITLNDKGTKTDSTAAVYNSYAITGLSSESTVTKISEEIPSSTVDNKTYTSVWHLDTADSWTIARGGSAEQDTLVYAKVIYDTIVDWHDSTSMGYDSATNIQSKTGTITSSTSGIEISVDATNGKLAARDTDAQFNAGTIITVPVNADSVLTVVSYPGTHNFTVAGAAATDDTTTFTATKDGYVSIVGTGSSYLYSITATNVTSLVDHTEELTVPFASSTETVTNDEDTLGLTATSVESSDSNVATAGVTADGIVITSVAAGSATITASDGTNSATIEVTVGTDGTVKYSVDKYVSAEEGTLTVTWDFQNAKTDLSSAGFTGTTATGTVKGTSSSILLSVDAGSSGKLNQRNSDAQYNSGTTIKVPVNVGSVVTVVSYPGYHNYTVAGTAASADTTTYTATTAGYVSIVATATSYLYSISATYETPVTWDFQNAKTDLTSTGFTGTTATGTVKGTSSSILLSVDAGSSGKLNQRDSDAQYNSGTTIKVPATVGQVVTVVSYPGYHNYTVGGTAANADTTTYTATATDAANGYVSIAATATSYLYSISLTTE